MELENPMLREQLVDHKENFNTTMVMAPRPLVSESLDDLTQRFKSFRILENGVPKSNSTEKKLWWLRSQVIGGDIEFDTPFGRRRLTYADHTASGRCLQYIEDYIIKNVLPFYGNSHTTDSFVGYRTTTMVHEASEYVKKCLGGGEDDAIIFCGSGTTAAIKRLQEVMGISISSIMRDKVLETLSSGERWVVFVGPYEHHSNVLSWRHSLAEVIEIGMDKDGLIDMDALKMELKRFQFTNRPMLGSFSACSNVTGTYVDTRSIASLLHRYGAFACFDFAASGPYVEIDMRSGELDGYDALFLSPHKFIGGPGSPGILLMNKALYRLMSSPPSTCGGGTVDFVNGYGDEHTIYLKSIEEREDAGTPQIIQKVRAALAFWVKEYIGYKAISIQEHNYIKRALERLLPNPNLCVLGNTVAGRQAIISFLVYTTTYSSSNDMSTDGGIQDKEMESLYLWRETGNKRDKYLHGSFVAKILNDLFGIQARGGCACAGPYGHSLLNVDEPLSIGIKNTIQKGLSGVKPGWTRISFPYYMSNEEFEFILAALEFIAIYGQRFLPLYHYNWKTGIWTFKKKAFTQTFQGKENSGYPLAKTLFALSNEHDEIEEPKTASAKDVGIINTYATYLKNAKHIASLLPKFPAQRRIPDDIDMNYLTFRV